MGYRLHVAKVYEIEYADKTAFDGCNAYDIKCLLSALDVSYSEINDDTFEVLGIQLSDGIEILERIDEDKEMADRDNILECCKKLDMQPKEIAKHFREYLTLAHDRYDWILFSFF